MGGAKADEDQRRADKNHHRGSISGLLSCVGGIAGEPSAVKVFMMWQKLIRVGAKSGPDVTLMNVVVCEFTDHLRLAVNICCEYLKKLFLTLVTCSVTLTILNLF